jgi:uracil-DNA glycosylase
MDVKIDQSWKNELSEEFEKQYFIDLVEFVKSEYLNSNIYPPGNSIFKAFELCPLQSTRVVILGQDPYHWPGQAMGLSFSVPNSVRTPPSLQNIYKEIKSDLDITPESSGDLTRWAKQGVLLLNATLTVREKSAGSHQKKGWEEFTDAVIKVINDKLENVVFLLWGNYAKQKGQIIDREKHYVLEAAHPSPFAAHKGFFGCKHFSKTNEYLLQNDLTPIDWK